MRYPPAAPTDSGAKTRAAGKRIRVRSLSSMTFVKSGCESDSSTAKHCIAISGDAPRGRSPIIFSNVSLICLAALQIADAI